jgi:vacuolar protein sorting-associated protein 13A/C
LRKYAYLSNDSSYSVALEDGVDVTLLDKSSSNDEKKSIHYMHESSDTSNISSNSQNDIKRMQSFTFETQVSDLSIPDLLQIRFSFDMFSFSVLL